MKNPGGNGDASLSLSGRRIRRLGVLGTTIAMVILLLAVPLFTLIPAKERFTPTVSVFDQANVVHPEALQKSLEEVGFTQKIHLVIITFQSLEGLDLNTATLKFARENNTTPPLINPNDPQFWNDATVILSLAPVERQIGTYFGEDVKVSLDVQASIQDSMKPELREQRWAPALVTGAKSTAEEISTDMKDSSLPWAVSIAMSTLGLGGLMTILRRGRSTRRHWRQARKHYANVSAYFETAGLEASILDHSNRHGAAIAERYTQYVQRYHQLTVEFQDFGTPRGLDVFLSAVRKQAEHLHSEAEALDNLDDAISNTAALLTMSSRWEQVWMNEIGPVHEDLESLRDLIREVSRHLSSSRVSGLTQGTSKIESEIAELLPQLQTRVLTPPEALDKLDTIHQRIYNLSQTILHEVADVTREKGGRVSKSDFEMINRENNTGYSGSWGNAHYNPNSTIRGNSRSVSARSTGFFSGTRGSVAGLVLGYQTSAINPSVYEASQSSSSSSSGGYSGGGGFSGSGSSSSF